uniref:CTP_transf_like domain-containing protein n=1 Tax=Heterorhabditis bacteriophora TaxID=37862 RepID=A0A1I7XI70_HETBA
MSPLNDFHSQTEETAAKHRLRMVEMAVKNNYWIHAGHWECSQQIEVKPISVLKHYQKKFIHKYGEDIRIMYLCGSNVLDDFAKVTDDSCSMWNQTEIRDLLKQHGLVVVQRSNTRPAHTIYLMDVLRKNQVSNIPVWKIPSYYEEMSVNNNREGSGTSDGNKTTCVKSVALQENVPEKGIDEEETLKGIPPQLPKAAFIKPILSLHQLYLLVANEPAPTADSPLLLTPPSPTRCEKPKTIESPNYDNVTLDELLAASTSWAEYMNKQCENEQRSFDKKITVPTELPSKELKEKKSWFFTRNRSLKETKPSPTSEYEPIIGICGTDRRDLPSQTEILWRNKIKSKEKEKWPDLTIPPRKSCARHPQATKSVDKTDKRKKECRNLRFASTHTKSTDNIHHRIMESGPSNHMTQSCCEGVGDGVTLRFRRYHLTATPETTV